LTDDLLLRVLGVACGLNLSLVTSGESDAEHTDVVAVSGLGLREGLDRGMPLLDESAKLVSGDVHAVEVSVAVVAFNFFALNADLSPGLLVSVLVKITEGDLENATTERVSGDF